jgi:acetyl esterase/lipase
VGFLSRPESSDARTAAGSAARYEDLAGLPPAWIGVGTNDLFHDEALAYAERLRQASVPVTLNVVPGAYHGFDVIEKRAAVSRAYRQAQLDALSQAWVADVRRR